MNTPQRQVLEMLAEKKIDAVKAEYLLDKLADRGLSNVSLPPGGLRGDGTDIHVMPVMPYIHYFSPFDPVY